jgi:hypothetical protein
MCEWGDTLTITQATVVGREDSFALSEQQATVEATTEEAHQTARGATVEKAAGAQSGRNGRQDMRRRRKHPAGDGGTVMGMVGDGGYDDDGGDGDDEGGGGKEEEDDHAEHDSEAYEQDSCGSNSKGGLGTPPLMDDDWPSELGSAGGDVHLSTPSASSPEHASVPLLLPSGGLAFRIEAEST